MKKWMLVLLTVTLTINAGTLFAQETRKEISLKDAIYHALKNNLDLRIQLQDAEYSKQSLRINNSIFIPALEVTGSALELNRPSEGALSGGDVIITKQQKLTLKLSQLTPWGGAVNLELDNTRTTSNSKWSNPDPSLGTEATLSLNQPLLKGFGLTATKKEIYVSANNLKKAKHQLREDIVNLVYQVEDAYWNLVYAYKNLDATKMALERSRDLLNQNEIKVKVGSAAPIEILSAKADVARNESNLIQAETTIQTAEENLKRILNMSSETFTVFPTDSPTIQKLDVNFNEFLHEGLKNRPDMERAKLDLANYEIMVDYTRNQTLPDLQLSATYYTTGRGGSLLKYLKNPLDPTFNRDTDTILDSTKSIWAAWEDVFKRLYQNYSVSLSLKIPLNFAKEKAQLAQAKINMQRAFYGLKKVESNIYSEVKSALKDLESNSKLMEADKIALELEEENLKAEEKKLSVGLSTNFNVLQYQKQYADAQTRHLRAIINYNLSLAKINKTLARTFSVYDIKIGDFIEEN